MPDISETTPDLGPDLGPDRGPDRWVVRRNTSSRRLCVRRRFNAACAAGAILAVGALVGQGGESPDKAGAGSPEAGEPAAEASPRDELAKPANRSGVSLEDATAIVRQAYGGRVVSADAATAHPAPGRPKESGHRVRVDVDGRVKTVFVDARGRIHENAEY